ncbi:oxidative damage protection protein [Candidatus Curculioniphilus buchneri]|uniref:oxidative damage protection protein n=1 Tax=Candidatus Curculioniphilus buchneri TaxID=690594 RepID=UPI00376EFE6C
MNRIIYCKFLKRKAKGQSFQIYPGKLGKLIYDTISQEAWIQWQKKQTIIINENKLSMLNLSDRKKLNQEMVNFLFKNQDIHIDDIC